MALQKKESNKYTSNKYNKRSSLIHDENTFYAYLFLKSRN